MSNIETEWGLSSGLPLADADVEVIECSFGYNNDIGAGVICANFVFRTEDGETHEQSFSVGKGWEIGAKGAELVSDSGKPRKLSTSSNYGILVGSALKAVGGPEKMAELGPGFRFASTWVGTKWHTDTIQVETTAPGSTEKKVRDRIVFSAFLGREGEAPAKGGAAADDANAEIIAKLVEMAKEADDHASFMEEALDLPEVEGNREVEKLVMNTKAGSIWKLAGK